MNTLRLFWLFQRWDALMIVSCYQGYIIFEERTIHQQVLLFISGKADTTYGKCALVAHFIAPQTAGMRPTVRLARTASNTASFFG